MEEEQIKKCLIGIQDAEKVLQEVEDDELFNELFRLEAKIIMKYDNQDNQ